MGAVALVVMIPKPWLAGYSGQTTDELIALDDVYRTDSIVLAIAQAVGARANRIGTNALTDAERVVLAVEALEREVNSGGYDSLFRYASDHVPLLVASLRAIGCDAVAALTEAAIALLEIDGPLTPESVRSAIESDDDERGDRLSDYDTAYNQVAGDLADPLFGYIKAHRGEISLT